MKKPDYQHRTFPLHPHSPAKRRTLAFSEEIWPVFRGQCAMRTRRKPSRTCSGQTKARIVQNPNATFLCALQGILRLAKLLHTKRLSLEAALLDIAVFPKENQDFYIKPPHNILLLNHDRALELKIRARARENMLQLCTPCLYRRPPSYCTK